MVQVDIPQIADWPAFKPGVEIFITNKYDKPINSNGNGHFEMAFLVNGE